MVKNFDQALYEKKVRGCWTGKNVGGILGCFYEGKPGPLQLSFYDPIPQEPLPNDDLELQLVWLMLAEKHGLSLNHDHLAQAWVDYIKYGMDEYGVAIWNIRRGIKPPLSGLHNNWFRNGMGAAIRSEIWACLFPAQPEIAAHFARMDSSVDHHGEGVWAEMFLAAAESAAFTALSVRDALAQGLNVIPPHCRIARVVKSVDQACSARMTPAEIRALILRDFGSHNFTDCVMNMGFIILGLLTGEKDFGQTILTAVNCGMDTDCTGATSGAFYGILHGIDGLDTQWLTPIGPEIACSDFLKDLDIPKTISELTTRVMNLSEKLSTQRTQDFTLDLSAQPCVDTIDDGHRWLVVPWSGDLWQEPPQVAQAEKNGGNFTESIAHFREIHADLSRYCDSPKTSIYLFTHLKVPCDVNGYLMLCADAGITAWLEDAVVLNYHGRNQALPACHRVEGGGSIPVKLLAGREYPLKIRLLFCKQPLTFTAAVLGKDNQYVNGFEFRLPTEPES